MSLLGGSRRVQVSQLLKEAPPSLDASSWVFCILGRVLGTYRMVLGASRKRKRKLPWSPNLHVEIMFSIFEMCVVTVSGYLVPEGRRSSWDIQAVQR